MDFSVGRITDFTTNAAPWLSVWFGSFAVLCSLDTSELQLFLSRLCFSWCLWLSGSLWRVWLLQCMQSVQYPKFQWTCFWLIYSLNSFWAGIVSGWLLKYIIHKLKILTESFHTPSRLYICVVVNNLWAVSNEWLDILPVVKILTVYNLIFKMQAILL